MPSGSGRSGSSGHVGICPVRNTQPSTSLAWEKAATGLGAPSIMKNWGNGMVRSLSHQNKA
jgi:hypothetical protein